MRTHRVLTSLALAAAGLALTAGPAAATTTPDPDIRSFPGGLSCSGDVVSGMVRVTSLTTTPVPLRVELRHNAGGRAYGVTDLTRSYTTFKGTRDYYFSFDVSALPASTINLVGYAIAGDPAAPIDSQQSKVLPISACAPAEVIPEAPVAALVPLSLAATAGAAVAVRRRRTGGAAA